METTTKAPTKRHRARRATLGALAFAVLAGSVISGGVGANAAVSTPAGSATSTLDGTLIQGGKPNAGTTTLFAFAAAGEQLHAEFEAHHFAENPATQGGRVVIKDPAGAVVYDSGEVTAPSATLGGTFTSTVSGNWSIDIIDLKTQPADDYVAANMEWSVAVLGADGQSKPGRVWSESLAIRSSGVADHVVYAINSAGAKYKIDLNGYDGVDSTLVMNNIGNAKKGEGVSVFKSVPQQHSPELDGAGADYWTPATAGEVEGLDSFRLFLDEPAADLPASVENWGDGRTNDTWVNPALQELSLKITGFTRDAETANAGTITGEMTGGSGVVSVNIDADGNGVYTDAVDRHEKVQVLEEGPFSLKWDGLDAAGKPVSIEVPVNIEVATEQANPLHFIRNDTETSIGGLSITTLNGPSAGDSSLYWDDTMFEGATSAERWSTTPELKSNGTASNGGVHGWDAGGDSPNQNNGRTGSWGDMRIMDDWAFQKVEARDALTVPLIPAAIEVTKYVNGEDANDPDTAAEVKDGEKLEFTATIVNKGGTTLDLALQDDVLPEGAFTCETMVLAPFASTECKATGDVLKPGEWHKNTLTVIGTPPNGGTPVKDEDPANAYNPGINIVKFINDKDANTVADAVELKPDEDGNVKGVVTNPLKVPVTIKVTDDVIAADKITCETYELAPGASTNCTAILPALGAGVQHVNTMTVEATTPKGTKVTDKDPAHAFTAPAPTPTPTPTTVPGKPSQPESLATTGAEQAAIGGGILLGIAALVGGAVLVAKRRKNAEGEATNES